MADTKRMIHDAYGLFHLQREGAGGDQVSGRLYGMAKGVWAGKVMASVEKQSRPLGDLLIICYAPDVVPSDANWTATKRALAGEIVRRHGEQIKQHRTLAKVRGLSEVAVMSFQREMRGTGRLEDRQVCLLAGIDRANWSRGDRPWSRWWEEMGRILHGWHRRGMEPVRAVCEEIESARERERLAEAG